MPGRLRRVQIKATQGRAVALRGDCDFLLVLKLDPSGGFEEVYNGPGAPVLAIAGKMQSNGQRVVGFLRLNSLAAIVKPEDRIMRKAPETSGDHSGGS